MNWTVHRDLFIQESLLLRARFDSNKDLKNPTLIEKVVLDGEAELKEYTHPAPYRINTMPGGTKYQRYPNNGLGYPPEVCAIPPWFQ